MVFKRSFTAGKAAFAGALSVALLLLLASCSPSSEDVATTDGGTDATTQQDAPDAEPLSGGELVIAQTTALETLSPQPNNRGTHAFRNAIYDPLVRYDGGPVPSLAESWEATDGNRSFTFNLREGVTYHDGTPFDADAVVWNMEWVQDPATGAQGAAEISDGTFTAVDETTVQFDFETPKPHLFGLLSNFHILKPESDVDNDGIGTGPFMVSDYQPGSQLTMTRNEDYWDQDALPQADSLVLNVVPDASTAAIGLEAGETHLYVFAAPETFSTLENAANIELLQQAGQGNEDLAINVRHDDMLAQDNRVRQALSLAYDRERYIETVGQGMGTPVYQMWPPASPVFSEELNQGEFNLDQARQLIEEAGAEGLEIEIQTDPASRPFLTAYMPVYQEDLASIGVNAEIVELERTVYISNLQDGTFEDVSTHQYGFASSDPALAFITLPFRPGNNASGFESEEYERLIQEGLEGETLEERIPIYEQIAELVRDEAFVIPIVNFPFTHGVLDTVTGVTLDHNGHPDYRGAALTQ